jgi:diguanylate cyclase (GGDEF)-like protein
VVALFAAWLHFEWFGYRTTLIVDDYGEALAAFIAAATCVWRGRHSDGQRLGWFLLGASAFSWALGELRYAHYEVVQHIDDAPFPSWADAGFLLAVPLAAAAVVLWPSAPRRSSERVRAVLDGTLIAASLLLTSWALVLGDLWRDGEDSWFGQAISLAYPLADVMIVTVILLALRRSRREQRVVLVLVMAGLVAMAVADTAFAYFTNQGTYSTDLTGVGWFAGYLLIALAALHPQTGEPGDAPSDDEDMSLSGVLLPYAPLVLAAGAALLEEVDRFEGVGLAVLAGLVIARQLVTLLENRDLSGRLRAGLHELQRQEVKLRHQAFHDGLTGLANRELFWDRLEHALALGDRRVRTIAVMYLDLDRFKAVNDQFGHAAGDKVLIGVAERLRASLRPADTVARLGGDEFGVLLEALDDRTPDSVAQRVLEALSTPFVVCSGERVHVGASIGVAVGRFDDADGMVAAADTAMYEAKAAGGGTVAVRLGLVPVV